MNKEPHRPNQQHIAASSDTQIVPSKPKLTDKSNLKCYRCGGLGHIVPNCPHPAQPRAAAAQITSEHDDDNDPTLGESFEGEQYDPELYSEENMEAHEIDHNQPESGQDRSYNQENYTGEYPDDGNPDHSEYQDNHEEPLVASYSSVVIPLEPQYEVHALAATAHAEPLPTVYRTRASRKSFPGEQPERNFDKPLSLSGYLSINGYKAHVLIDTGCTTDMVSPDYLAAMGEIPFELDNPVGLQMATRGSRARINYGYRANLTLGNFRAKHYVDVANLDQYDIILGSGFMRKHKVILDFTEEKRAAFILNGERHVENIGDFGSPKGGKKLTQLYKPPIADRKLEANTVTTVNKPVDMVNNINIAGKGKRKEKFAHTTQYKLEIPIKKTKPSITGQKTLHRNAVAGPSKGPKPK
jgi:hypothetical protein